MLERNLRHSLSKDRHEKHGTDRLREGRVEKGSGRLFNLIGRERFFFKQTKIRTLSWGNLGRLPGDRVC